MSEPDLFAALRAMHIDADDPQIRASVRLVTQHADGLRSQKGTHVSRRSLEAMHAALTYELLHPPVDDMSSFEDSFDAPE